MPKLDAFKALLEDSGEREISTTMAFSRALSALMRDKAVGPRVVPIVADETRTFGMEGMFRQVGIYSAARPALPAARRRPADVVPRRQDRPDPAGGHQRSRRDVVVDRRRDVVLDARQADDPVLHLLLDVRVPAHRRFHLGGRRHALARLPDRRHRRPHDAQRRGPAARRRPEPPHGVVRSRTACRTIRPTPTRSR